MDATPRIGEAVTYRGMRASVVEHVTLSVVWIEYAASGNRARVHISTLTYVAGCDHSRSVCE